MTDFNFFDTNILYYSKYDNDKEKRNIALDLINKNIKEKRGVISVQVLNEFINNSIHKAKRNTNEIISVIDNFIHGFHIVNLTSEITQDALRIIQRYQFSIWDSLIVASALYAKCNTLYTEDLSSGQIIDGKLIIINPFDVKKIL